MKKLFYILYILLTFSFTSNAQNKETIPKKEQPPFKNQIDLDVYLLGVEGSYKRRVKPKLYAGLGLGTTMLRPALDSDFSILSNGFWEVIRIRPFLDFTMSRNFHLELGLSTALAFSFHDGDDSGGYSISPEVGVFFRIRKIDIGLRPSLFYYRKEGKDNFSTGVLTTSLLIIKIPLSRW